MLYDLYTDHVYTLRHLAGRWYTDVSGGGIVSEDRAEYTWGGRRPGAGRKPPPGGRRRSRGINLNDAEWQDLQRLAARAGCGSVSEYIRRMLLGSPD